MIVVRFRIFICGFIGLVSNFPSHAVEINPTESKVAFRQLVPNLGKSPRKVDCPGFSQKKMSFDWDHLGSYGVACLIKNNDVDKLFEYASFEDSIYHISFTHTLPSIKCSLECAKALYSSVFGHRALESAKILERPNYLEIKSPEGVVFSTDEGDLAINVRLRCNQVPSLGCGFDIYDQKVIGIVREKIGKIGLLKKVWNFIRFRL